MSVTQEETPAPVGDPEPEPAGPPGPRGSRRADLIMVLLAAGFTALLTCGLWLDPNHRTFSINASDQALFEWMLAFTADALRHGHDPLWTTLLNAPGGANLAVNTCVTVLGVLLAPVTLTLGPSVAYVGAITLGILATPVAWYLLLSRLTRVRPAAAIVGALFCGYAPGLVSHANGHLNFASGYLVPVIVWRILALRRPGHAVRDGVVAGVLIAAQYSLGGETLFFAGLAVVTFLVFWWALGGRADAVAFGRGLAVAAGSAFVLLAYPLWMQFFGPGSFHGTGFDQNIHSEDLLAYGAFPARSLAGVLGLHADLAVNPTEENSFLGVPVLLTLAGMYLLAARHPDAARRRPARAVGGSAAVFAVLSLGPWVKIDGHRTWIPLPYWLLSHLPLFDSALPGRLALVAATFAGVLLALGLDRLPRAPRPRLVTLGVALALLSVFPVPLRTMDRSGVPHFITSGAWRAYVRPGRTLVPVPPASDWLPDGQRWQTYQLWHGDGSSFRIPAGFFLGPGGPHGHGRIGPPPRPTFTLLATAAIEGRAPAAVTDRMRRDALADVRYWQGSVIVMPVYKGVGDRWHGHYGLLLSLATQLYGPPTRVDDVWMWRV